MAREVENQLGEILGKAKGGGKLEGDKELKLLKDRNRLLLDVSLSFSLRPFSRSFGELADVPFSFQVWS